MTRDLRLLLISQLLFGIADGLISIFRPLYLEQLGASPVAIGSILGLAGAALAISHIPAGVLSDRIGPKKLLSASWIIATLAIWMMYLARSLPLYAAGLVIYYFSGFFFAPLSRYVTSARGRWTLVRALTLVSASYSAGLVFGPLLGGHLGESYGLRALHGLAAILGLCSSMVMLFLRPQQPEPAGPGIQFRSLLSNTAFQRLLFLVMAISFPMLLSWPLTPNYLKQVHHVTVSQIGAFGSVFALGGVVLNLILGRLRAKPALLLTQTFVAGSTLLFWLGTKTSLFALGYLFFAGYITTRSLLSSTVEELVQRREMGLAYGLVEAAGSLMILAAPPLAGLLYEVNPALPLPVSGMLLCASFLLTTFLFPKSTLEGEPASAALRLTPPERK